MLTPLALILHLVVAATLMGIAITAALVAGFTSGLALIAAAAGGFLLGFPASWAIARTITVRSLGRE